MKAVLYLCDGLGCRSDNKSCRGDPEASRYCKHTSDPAHAVNGACDAPEKCPERFEELTPGVFWEKSS